MFVERGEIEHEVKIGLEYSREAGEDGDFEIVSLQDKDGKSFELTKNEEYKAMQQAHDDIEFSCCEEESERQAEMREIAWEGER